MALTTAENFAASMILTDWPESYTYDELLTGIESGNDDDIFVCQQFENDYPHDIVQSIEDMRVTFIRYVTSMTADLREAIRNGDPMTIAEQLQSLENQLGV